MAYGDPKDADSAHRLLASIQTSPEEYRKITSSSDKDAAEDFFPNSFETVRDDRLAEAAQTGADILVDVCHHCHNVFCNKESENGFKVMNYASLVAEALGIEREDKFKKYKQWKDLNRILDDVEENIKISASPFSQEKIIEVLKETLNL